MTREEMQKRYDELCELTENKEDEHKDPTPEWTEWLTQRTQLFYMLNPECQYWLSEDDQRTPEQIWGYKF